ncbi:GNAT family N-acetyltransferase [Pseudoduganella chitinolytica]|uniref:GNAT family N-acetyltransferase n=1 Tax=Pseudoduganella chitinolytica TaxID=34070 RepID=A0ABY8B6L3_9BURK|nr:GNAT family N-acetyltransferase [Pseudoduganella chitinolytica]WEF31574.1 GNAT family N-acetyltransferase [Pseudoduganella chitinolytica]
MTMPMTIRPTTAADWRALKAIRLAALRDAPTAFGVTHASAVAYSDEQWQTRAAGTDRAEYVLAFDGEQAVGIVAGVVSAKEGYNLIAMWVQPDYRGRGLAGGLIDALKARALAKGHRRVVLDVAPENTSAANLYLRQGFAFLPEWEPLESHPEISVQKMAWAAR